MENITHDGYYLAYELFILSYISFMFIGMKLIHSHSCMMFAMKSMSIYNKSNNDNEIIVQ